METNYPAVICQGKQQRESGGPGQAGDKQPSQATLFMAFLCISVFIWTFLSWRAGIAVAELRALALAQGRLSASGAPGQGAGTGPGGHCRGDPWAGVCAPGWIPPGTARALA